MLKKIFILFSFVFVLSTNAQAPEKMSYQAVIRNSGNSLVTNQSIGMRISILQTTATGTAVYVETQTPTTNANGLASIEIGAGTVVTGTFANINWGADKYFIKTETDPTGGTAYSITGTSQLLSAPYALYAKKAGNGTTTQLIATKTTGSQVLSSANGTNTGDAIVFDNASITPTSGIGSYDNATGIYTVGASGAGTYLVQARTMALDNTGTPTSTVGTWIYIEVNNSVTGSPNNVYPPYIASNPSNLPTGMKSVAGKVEGVIKLNSGDTFRIKGLGANSSVAPQALKTDGSCILTVVKLN